MDGAGLSPNNVLSNDVAISRDRGRYGVIACCLKYTIPVAISLSLNIPTSRSKVNAKVRHAFGQFNSSNVYVTVKIRVVPSH